MKLKILSVDFYLRGAGIRNASFLDAPSFSDYDVVIIDPNPISEFWTSKIRPEDDGSLWSYSLLDGGFGNSLKQFFNNRAEEINLLLSITGGILICILRNKGSILNLASSPYVKDKSSAIARYSWFPNARLSPYFFNPVYRIGESIKIVDKKHPFSQFISVLKENIYYEAIIDGLSRIAKPIAVSKVGELIGCEVSFGKGKIIFLPPTKKVDQDMVAGILIDCIRKSL